MTLLEHHVLALRLTALTTLGLGVLVFFSDRKRRLNQIFGLYSLSISWWAFWESLVASAVLQQNANLFAHLQWLGVFFIAPMFVHTVFLFTEHHSRVTRLTLQIAYGTSFIFVILHLLFDLIIKNVSPVAYTNFISQATPLGTLSALLFFILVNMGLWQLGRCYINSTGQRRVHIKYLFWASLIGYLGGGADWLFVFGTHVPVLNPFGIYSVPLYSIATTYAVLQHNLFDFKLVIRKSLIYSLLVTTLTISYFGLVYAIEQVFQTTLGYKSTWISLGAFAMMALLFQPLKVSTQRLVDWLIFRAPQHELVKRLEKLEQEAHKTEKLKAITTLAAGLCHELRNPLQTIRTHAEFLPERYDDPVFRKKCTEVMQMEIGRIDEFLKQLMEFAKPKQPTFTQVEPHKILDSTLDLLSNEFVRRRVRLDKQYKATTAARLRGDSDQLRQIILNLILNALEAIGQEGEILVKTSHGNGWFTLEVSDTGPGIDPKILPKLFEPFTTTKPDGNGLGLSIVHSIILEHKGKISVQNQAEKGALFIIKLPIT